MPFLALMNRDHALDTRVSVTRDSDYRFRVRFHHGRVPDLFTDEPPPLAAGGGPAPQELLAAAIGADLCSSLLFCMQKARLEPRDLSANVVVSTARDEKGRLRIERVDVELVPTVTAEIREKMALCVESFRSFCTVSESVQQGLPVHVELAPREIAPSPAMDE
jgi:organic hydroperoxide reductase OsmC/OhrA